MSSITKVCSVAGCNKSFHSRMMCLDHYGKWYRTTSKKPQLLGNHGLNKTPEYKVHNAMKQRCINPHNQSYKNYGGRGIKVCNRWLGLDGFENFILDMDWRPTSKHTLDRIDNNQGYSPSNCRWATQLEQQSNKRKFKNNKSGYRGVLPSLNKKNWTAVITHDYRNYYIGTFSSPELAAVAYDTYSVFLKGSDGVTNIL